MIVQRTIQKAVDVEKLTVEIQEALLPLVSLLKKVDAYTFTFSENINETTLDTVIDNHSATPTLSEQIKTTYDAYAFDGRSFFADYRVRLIEGVQQGTYTEAQIIGIDKTLVYVKSFILSGDWKTAKSQLDATLINLDFTLAEKEYLQGEIQNYIDTHYA